MSGYKRNDRGKETCDSKENGSNSSRDTVLENLNEENMVQNKFFIHKY